jgi:hypothetical protein
MTEGWWIKIERARHGFLMKLAGSSNSVTKCRLLQPDNIRGVRFVIPAVVTTDKGIYIGYLLAQLFVDQLRNASFGKIGKRQARTESK